MEKDIVLLANDDPFTFLDIGKTLESQGYKVATTDNDEKAIDLLNKSSFDLVIEELAGEGVVFIDRDGRIEEANQAYLEMLGYSLDEIRNKPHQELTPEHWHAFEKREIVEKQLLKRGYSDLYEKEYIRRDGTVFPVSLRIWRVKDKEGVHSRYIALVRDITEKKRLQDHLIRSERLAAAGQLATCIAHEINSPLQGMLALLDLIQKTGLPDKELATNIELLKSATRCIRNTVKKMVNLNRPHKGNKQSVDVNQIIADAVALFRSYLRKNRVGINLNLSSKCSQVKASPQQLGHVLTNLIVNAVEAINGESQKNSQDRSAPASGVITIDTYPDADSIVIKISDTGPGIPDEAMTHIFDSFYSQKKTLGMGIGLSVCHAIMEEHQGTISAMNSPEGGALLTLTLPVDQTFGNADGGEVSPPPLHHNP